MQTKVTEDEGERTFKRTIIGLVILALAGTAGIVTASVREGKSKVRVLRTDANWHRAAAEAEKSFWQSVEDVDDVLSRPDKGTDQHG